MRQTLIKVLLQDLFGFRIVEGTATDEFEGWGDAIYIGAGWSLIPWAIIVLVWMAINSRNEQGEKIPFATRFPLSSLLFPAIVLVLLPILNAMGTLPEEAPIFGYGLFLCLAFIVCLWDLSARFRREGLPSEWVGDLGLWLFISGLVGCRIFFCIQYSGFVFKDANTLPGYLFAFVNLQKGGMVLYGGLILGVAAFFLWCHLRKLPSLYIADLLMPAVLLGICIGRLGCLMNGCCFGDQCSLPIAIQFPPGSIPFSEYMDRGLISANDPGIWVHPTQIYSSMNAFLLFLVLAAYFRVRHRDGAVMALGIAAYATTRFAIEFLRNDEGGQFQTSFTISQWVSMAVILGSVGLLAYLMRTPGRRTSGSQLMAELAKLEKPKPKTRSRGNAS